APFDGETINEVLRAHLAPGVPDVRAHRPDVPDALVDVLGRLLCPRPEDRYDSAESVRADLTTIAEALARGEQPDRRVLSTTAGSRTLLEPTFIGRARELQELGG